MSVLNNPLINIKSWIMPEVNICKAFNTFSMLTQDDNLDILLPCSDELRLKSLMLLRDIATQFQKILLAINDQSRIINVHVITNPQLGAEIIHSYAVELAFYAFPLFFVLSSIALDGQSPQARS